MSLHDDWLTVTGAALALVATHTQKVALLRAACWGMPAVRRHILLRPSDGLVHVGLAKEATAEDAEAWGKRLHRVGFKEVSVSPADVAPPGLAEGDAWLWIKSAEDPALTLAAKVLNYRPSEANRLIGGPSPLAAALASGALGAGVGYLGGSAVESLLPEGQFAPGAVRRNMALAGAGVAAAPAVLWGLSSQEAHPGKHGARAWLSGWPFRPEDESGGGPIKRAVDLLREVLGGNALEKDAFELYGQGQGLDQLSGMPMIPKDQFGRVVFSDPNTPASVRAATVGLVGVASAAAGDRPFVSPYDVARVAAGGLARGLIVGKTLGALAGLRPEVQKDLQRVGVWGSLLTAVVPNAFPDNNRIFGAS